MLNDDRSPFLNFETERKIEEDRLILRSPSAICRLQFRRATNR